ncbi:hypothetical protein MNBD_ACTINO02-1352 [hydrothermal vent metagenome]|uniref:Uncharacterized protein n=1 Tax=hydrothermal vent metagenome TaxID=652676 RepID=A0A3B0SW30_9ZZZZ
MGRPSKWRGSKALPAMPGGQSRMTPGIQPRYGAPSSNPIRRLDQFFLFGAVVDLRNRRTCRVPLRADRLGAEFSQSGTSDTHRCLALRA